MIFSVRFDLSKMRNFYSSLASAIITLVVSSAIICWEIHNLGPIVSKRRPKTVRSLLDCLVCIEWLTCSSSGSFVKTERHETDHPVGFGLCNLPDFANQVITWLLVALLTPERLLCEGIRETVNLLASGDWGGSSWNRYYKPEIKLGRIYWERCWFQRYHRRVNTMYYGGMKKAKADGWNNNRVGLTKAGHPPQLPQVNDIID